MLRQIKTFRPQEIRKLAEEFLREYIQINVGSLSLAANHNIMQLIDCCQESDKENRLYKILQQITRERNNKTIVFVETKRKVDSTVNTINRQGFRNVVGIHGDKSQNERDYVLKTFRGASNGILVATDVASRGLGKISENFCLYYLLHFWFILPFLSLNESEIQFMCVV